MLGDKHFKTRILVEVVIQAQSVSSADRRWTNALRALDPSRYPGLKITQQIEPRWIEIMEEDVDSLLDND